ncbi:MAG TPA: hypothetical protein VGB05_05335, partial [Pyrinomonadaceae bacterium]
MSVDTLDLDYETASRVDLKSCGLDVYARDPSTRPILLSYKLNDEPAQLVDLWDKPFPKKLRDMMEDPGVRKIAHNAAFEIAISKHCLGIRTDPSQWYCTMIMALSLGLPASLEQLVRDALKLPREFWKDERGSALMRLFSYANSKATPWSHPNEWREYGEYCRQDTVAEAKVFKVLRRYIPNLGRLFDEWVLDQKINSRGLPVDLTFIDQAQRLAAESKAKYKKIMQEMTGLENPNSTKQVAKYLQDRGYPFASTAKNRTMIAKKDFADRLTDEAVELIDMRTDSNKTSLAKYAAIKRA